MALFFPRFPAINQLYTAPSGTTYRWDGEKWTTFNVVITPEYYANNLANINVSPGPPGFFVGPPGPPGPPGEISGGVVSGNVSIVLGNDPPLIGYNGQLWFDTDNTTRAYIYVDGVWVDLAPSAVPGPSGPPGPPSTVPGPSGATGPASMVAGPPGSTGPDGATGSDGPPGPPGSGNGPTGATGPSGPSGATGPASTVPGPSGATGPASIVPGPSGATGPSGPSGATGPASTVRGSTGATGPASTVPGPTGATGPSGAPSTNPGPPGPPGISSRITLSGTTSSIANGSFDLLNVNGYKGYALVQLGTSHPARVVVYSSNDERNADNRTESEDPIPGTGVIAEVITYTGLSTGMIPGAITQNLTPVVFGYSRDNESLMRLKVYNKSGSTRSITVYLKVIPIEV